MPATSSLTDCERLATAVQEVGGRIPKTLAGILSGAALLNAHSGATDPARRIVDAAVAGELTEKPLNDLLTEAAHQQMVASYAGELKARSERMFVTAFHAVLKDGAADEILVRLRPAFDTAAEAITAARDVIPPTMAAEEFLRTAKPAALTVWRELDSHLATITAISAIAAQFGPRNGNFPLIEEFALGDGFRLEDRAIWCADGPNLEADSAVFRRPDQGHRTSPWFRIPLRLHSVESAQARYDEWASDQWERLHAGPPESWIDEHGKMHERPRPKNPFKAKESVR